MIYKGPHYMYMLVISFSDIGELINKVEDLKYMNHKLNEDNVQLNSQLEAQDEQITYLTTELVNKNKEEEQWKKKLKRFVCKNYNFSVIREWYWD